LIKIRIYQKINKDFLLSQTVEPTMQEETVKEVAPSLKPSNHTVDQHTRNIRHKLNVLNNAELEAFAKEAGLT